MGIFEIIGWAIFGLIVGLIARLLMPGRDPMGLIMTSILGIAGSLLGGLLVYYVLHEAAHRAVRVWVLRRGQLDKKKLAKALITSPKRG